MKHVAIALAFAVFVAAGVLLVHLSNQAGF